MQIQRDVMTYDMVVVGAGPAGLGFAIRLKQLSPEKTVCVLEKGSQVGAHILSGCVMEPKALDGLLPEWRKTPPAICVPAAKDEFALLTKTGRIRLPTPPQMENQGNFIISLGSLCAWLGTQAEALGVDVFPGFTAAAPLIEDGKVMGVRCGDMGLEKDGTPGPNFAAGVDIRAGTTVMAEGCRGSVSKRLIKEFRLDADSSPQTYGLGFKELWHLPPGRVQPGLIQHTLGWPLDTDTYGGSFLYHLDQDRVYIGFVVGLDYQDPDFQPFEAFQQFKHHPSVKPLLEGGEILSSGARTLIEGGLQSLPKLEMPGALLIGDAAGTLNVPKIKGVHMALRSGMLAAEHLAEKGTSEGFDARWRRSPSAKELHTVRNLRPGFRWGLWAGLINAALETITFGLLPWTLKNHADWSSLKKRASAARHADDYVTRTLPPRDRLASVYFATTTHDEHQPAHLKVSDTDICATRCAEEFGNPCTRFCPAQVYEMVQDGDKKRLQINAANCVHCKACDIKDPYEIITWTTPEGGSGPNYQNL
ncbi:MAG TPA: electron transfer flavoprotein-ubiquinone oxidoreductase [Gammaproteobacteria bacterium]|jgi:electron-transferring-flavoprotein dehydrogenase|nr:electron transfer flavoprotein-ubiquinone oxidoreductase [Gammaproteobacteria bacterium]